MTVLAGDEAHQVGTLLGGKLDVLTIGLPPETQSVLRRQALETLLRLVSDEAERVRAAIAEAVKDMPDAPRELILRLAHDPSVMVAEPVILFSPLLSTQDLLRLIATAPSSGTVVAVARRPAIDAQVSDAVVASANAAAIHALLANPSAQIREAVLDALIAASAEHTDWQEPLVHRPVLSPSATRALSDVVQAHLLAALAARPDIEPALADRLAERLNQRPAASRPETTAAEALAEAYRLASAGVLTEHTLLAAVRRGDHHLTAALLSVAAEVPVKVVEHAASSRSSKGLVSLVWQAGFSMRAGMAVQGLLGWLSLTEALQPTPGGGFPLTTDEMRWQIEFLGQSGH